LAITEADRSDRSGPVIRVGLGFHVKSPIVTRFGRGMSSPAYKYKGCGRLRVFLTTIESYQSTFIFLLNPSFSNLFVVLLASLRRLRAFWVAQRLQDKPRSSSSDGVPPEFEVLGLRGFSASNRSVRPVDVGSRW